MSPAENYIVRPIAAEDDIGVAALIRKVMPEFGAVGPGFAINDPEVDHMFSTYDRPRSGYWVIAPKAEPHLNQIVGAGGFGHLRGADAWVCEVQKMYFLKEIRGLGLGSYLLKTILEAAKKQGFSQVYLETLSQMTGARALYERHGFKQISAPMGQTGHGSCDTWYSRSL